MFVNPLTYPTDSTFVKVLSPSDRERLVQLGFDEPQAVMFQVPYCAISGFGAGIIRDYARRCFYRFFCATCSVIDGLPDDLLRIVVEHEQQEICEALVQASEAHHSSAFTTLEAEAQRHIPEFTDLARKHGQDVVDRAITETARLACAFPTVPRYVILYWLTAHVVADHTRYSAFAFQMPPTMLAAEQRGRHKELLDRVAEDYGSRLP